MIKQILYWSDNGKSYITEEEALKADAKLLESRKFWDENHNPYAQLDKLKFDLDKCMYVHPDTIVTCTFDCMRFKGMVNVCKEFYEKHKHNLQYY